MIYSLAPRSTRSALPKEEHVAQPNAQEPEPLFYSVDEVARMSRLGRSNTYERVASGEIPSVRVGQRILIPARAVHEWAERLIAAAGGAA